MTKQAIRVEIGPRLTKKQRRIAYKFITTFLEMIGVKFTVNIVVERATKESENDNK